MVKLVVIVVVVAFAAILLVSFVRGRLRDRQRR